jgi:uracil phosphoribosyltransferase
MLNILSERHSIVHQYLAEIRDVNVQNDRLRFRRNLERIGEIAAYEISRGLDYTDREIVTPLGIAGGKALHAQPVVATILRAGLALHAGILHIFDHADCAFVSAYRRHRKDGSFDIHLEYVSAPALDGKVVILSDPMLATGQSVVESVRALFEKGRPRHLHIVTAIASVQGVEYVKSHLPDGVTLWAGAVDEELTAQAYIVPGLGDAGDLAFGNKL